MCDFEDFEDFEVKLRLTFALGLTARRLVTLSSLFLFFPSHHFHVPTLTCIAMQTPTFVSASGRAEGSSVKHSRAYKACIGNVSRTAV